ncbi:addiction module toxin, HicA family [Pseudomonas laurylsulfativorans]|uniref:Addiction module toxin, HicA family n=1 Tax=Pseudomonas laurylsulfativorans TaxID=1943631 RepID=A0A2S3VPN1_9PSED|nr:type II toxin-antitoxin system HicA family toxin [Pseudomonas laurylsulfativorans]POF41904.1 addiction module toxin, HicA family [Pseudomonas laurylsulfativorans]
MQSRLLIKELVEAGWTLDRVTGSHQKDLPIGTVKSIRRRAGLYCPPASYIGDP